MPLPTEYDDPTAYAKYLPNHCDHCGGKGCDHCKEKCCNDTCPCPAGLVKVLDDSGNCAGCLTPSDAELFKNNNTDCAEGTLKQFDTGGRFLGCVSVADYKTLNP